MLMMLGIFQGILQACHRTKSIFVRYAKHAASGVAARRRLARLGCAGAYGCAYEQRQRGSEPARTGGAQQTRQGQDRKPGPEQANDSQTHEE